MIENLFEYPEDLEFFADFVDDFLLAEYARDYDEFLKLRAEDRDEPLENEWYNVFFEDDFTDYLEGLDDEYF